MTQTAASQAPSIWRSLDKAGARCMTLESSDFLFFERSDAQDSLPGPAARSLESLRSLVSDNSIVLFDQAYRVEALVSLDRLLDISINDYSRIGTIGFAPSVSHRLGQWRRRDRLSNGLWSVVFEEDPPGDPVLRENLERHLLVPWVRRRQLKLHARLRVPSKTELYIGVASGPAGKRVRAHNQWLEWECVLLTTMEQIGFWRSGHTFPTGQRVEHTRADALFLDADHNKLVRVEAKHVSKAAASPSASDATPQTVVVDPAMAAQVESIASALDDAFNTLSSTPNARRSEARVATQGDSASSADCTDPVATAIEIRERLKQSVNLIDAAKWAKWRGVQSNPSAALGKYKQNKRIFAVRSGNRDLYPAFQFAENAQPLPVLQKILKHVPKEAQGWPLLSWFDARNALLKNRKPSEVLASEPTAVVRAAARFYSRDD